MRSATPDVRIDNSDVLPLGAGSWRVDSSRSTASFAARVAGKAVHGRCPLSGAAYVSSSIEESAAQLFAPTRALRTGSVLLDRMLAGPGFLDAEAHPDISFRSEMLVCVPTGWRAVGHLRVKDNEHPLVCELEADLRDQRRGSAAMTVTTRWVLDSTWITRQRVSMLARRIDMRCRIAFEQVDELNDRPSQSSS
jgi:polyisoprenoid-binding protein YceI